VNFKNLLIFSVVFSLFCVPIVFSQLVSHPASEITPGTFVAGDFAIVGDLSINNEDFAKLIINSTGDGLNTGFSSVDFYDNSVAKWGIGKAPNNNFFIDLAGVGNAITIDSNRNVGIGTTSPTQKLDVIGNVKGTGLCIGNDCRTSWPTSTTPSLQTVTNVGRTTTQNIRSPRFEDNDNPSFYLDPASTSRMNAITPNSIRLGGVTRTSWPSSGGGWTGIALPYCFWPSRSITSSS